MSAFSNFFGKIGHGISSAARTVGHGLGSAFNTVGHGLSSVAQPLAGMASQFMPMIGTGLGGMVGGPVGMSIGSMLGGSAGNLLGSLSQGGNPSLSSFMPSTDTLRQLASSGSGYINQMLPPEYQNMSLGQMANNFGSGVGSRFNQMLPASMQGYGMGSHLGNFLSSQLASRIPQGYRDQNLAGAVYRYGSGNNAATPYGSNNAVAPYNNADNAYTMPYGNPQY